jgi:hypothetical protein
LARPGTPISSAEQRDQGVLDHLLLAEYDGACSLVHALDTLACRLDAGDNGFVGLGECAHDPELYTLHRWFSRNSVGNDGHNMDRLARVLKTIAICRMITQRSRNNSKVEGM